MSADYNAYQQVLKEVWTSDRLESSLYEGTPFLDKLEKRQPRASIGDKALVGVHLGRSGGYSVVPRTGSNALNDADEQKVNSAEYEWTHHWFQVEIDTATVDETQGKAKSVAEVVDTEVGGAIADMRRQITRQLVGGNGDALIAECGTTTAANEVELSATGDGYDAIVRGWLYPGLQIDIGTTADEDSVVAGATITAVEEDVSTPSITIDGAAVTTAAGDYVSIKDARSGTTSYEANGLRNIVSTADLGGLSASTYPRWKSYVDNTAQDLSIALLYRQQREVFQRTGKNPNWCLTSPIQHEALSLLLQQQQRWVNTTKSDGGNFDTAIFAGMEIDTDPDVRDQDWFTLTKEDLFAVRTEAPAWASQKYGGNREPIEWKQGTTKLVGGLVYRMQLAASRRDSHAALTDLNR